METVAEESVTDITENIQAGSSSTEMAATPAVAPTAAPIPTPTIAPTPTVAPTPTIAPTPTVAPTPIVAPTPTVAPTHTHSEPPRRRRDDRNKKEDEYVKQFMKAINSAPTLEEKMQIAIQKYSHMVDDNKKMQFYIKQSEKRHAMVMKEKDQLQLEFNKTILVKSKLENLCRELQKQNKTIKEESLLKIREEEERRKETQAKFQNTLAEITALLQQNNEKNTKLRDDNITMTEKFKSVVAQYQLRDQQIEKMTKQMALEQQLADAKLMKANLEHRAERERLMAEMEGLRASVQQHRAKVMELHGTETGLRSQLAVYTDKYDEFQNALVKSNKVFGGFKEEMEKMSKKIKKLEKESLSWKKRWETSQTALLDMCGERQASEERAAGVARQLHNMQSLCRTLQAERTVLLGTLKEHNIERPPLPAPVPAPPPPPAPAHPHSNTKVDAMAANCAQLRQSLAHLQSQLNVLTNKQQTEELPKTEKTKKSKSKKSKKQEVLKESESDSNAKESATDSANEEKVANVGAIVDAIDVDDKEASADKAESANAEAVVDKTDSVVKVDATDKAEPAGKPDKVEADVAKDVIKDDKTLESLIQAINSANINLADLEVIGDDKIDLDDILDVDSLTKSTDTASDASELSKDTSNEQSPKNEPKPVVGVEEITNGMKVILVTDRLGDGAKVVEFTEEITNGPKGPKIVELTDDIAKTPKIIELPDEVTPNDAIPESSNIGIPKEVKDVANTEIKAKANTTAQVDTA